MDEAYRDKVRARAYAIWEREGCPDGRADAHWAMAEDELQREERRGSQSRCCLVGLAGCQGRSEGRAVAGLIMHKEIMQYVGGAKDIPAIAEPTWSSISARW
jgi:hypothetical protein